MIMIKIAADIPNEILTIIKQHAARLKKTQQQIYVDALREYTESPQSRYALLEERMKEVEKTSQGASASLGKMTQQYFALEKRVRDLEARLGK